MWWNIHKTIRWTVYDSPMAKRHQKLQADLDKLMTEPVENANKKNPK
jgi:hypothetical protein